MNIQELNYCLAKQLSTISVLSTNYGDIDVYYDDELKKALEKTARRILEKRLKKLEKMEGGSK